MEACIFNTTFSILMNVIPTKDFRGLRGLRQGNPLSPFLFSIVDESLVRLVKRAVTIGKFRGIKINEGVEYNILQFEDNTIYLGECLWDNVCGMKEVLRGFELVFGLKVNFFQKQDVWSEW